MPAAAEKKIMILHNFSREDYTKLLASLKSIGLSKNTIIAVTTPVTLEWKMEDLLNELLLEDESLKGEEKK